MSASRGSPTRTLPESLRPLGMAVILLLVLVLAVAAAVWLTRDGGPVLTVKKPTGGTVMARGITCGTRGDDCRSERTVGEFIEIQAEADEGYTFAGYTDDCAPGGRVIMDGSHTCGATFEKLAAPGEKRWKLTITPPKNGTVVTLEGHQCGTTGSVCELDVPEGRVVRLDVMADPGFRVGSFTGDCVVDGSTSMTQPRTCGVVLVGGEAPAAAATAGDKSKGTGPGALASSTPAGSVPQDAGSKPGTPAESTPPSAGASSAGPSPAVTSSGPPSATGAPASGAASPGAGASSAASGPAGSPAAGASSAAPGAASPEGDKKAAEELARKEIVAVLNAYRDAYARMDVAGMKQIHPSVDVRRYEMWFSDLKTLKYTFGGDPKIEDLDVERGQARAIVDVKTESEHKAGKKQKPLENETTFLLKRIRETEAWQIVELRYKPK